MSHENDDLADYEAEAGTEQQEAAVKSKNKAGHAAVSTTGFSDFLLRPELRQAITDCGFEHPSEVQIECIPQAISGQDILCQAKSGMGKTAVFVLAVLQQLQVKAGEDPVVQALVMCHTRELAYQITHEFARFTKLLPDVKVGNYFGGVDIKKNKDDIKTNKPSIVVGTPGRIKQLATDKTLDLSHIRFFVLDECDKMLEKLDMRTDVQKIFTLTPHEKQVMMFTATMDEAMRLVCKKFMTKPVEVRVDNESKLTLHGLVQHYVTLHEQEKNKKLVDLLDALDFNQVVIFVKDQKRAKMLNTVLNECNFPSDCIFGGMDQQKRLDVYSKFRNNQIRILVATDLVGRGIDVERVNIVVNYDMPETDEKHGNGSDTYLHRVGRAGRFGTKGLAVTFVSNQADSDVLNQVQERFDVDIQPLPDKIDAHTYMENVS